MAVHTHTQAASRDWTETTPVAVVGKSFEHSLLLLCAVPVICLSCVLSFVFMHKHLIIVFKFDNLPPLLSHPSYSLSSFPLSSFISLPPFLLPLPTALQEVAERALLVSHQEKTSKKYIHLKVRHHGGGREGVGEETSKGRGKRCSVGGEERASYVPLALWTRRTVQLVVLA